MVPATLPEVFPDPVALRPAPGPAGGSTRRSPRYRAVAAEPGLRATGSCLRQRFRRHARKLGRTRCPDAALESQLVASGFRTRSRNPGDRHRRNIGETGRFHQRIGKHHRRAGRPGARAVGQRVASPPTGVRNIGRPLEALCAACAGACAIHGGELRKGDPEQKARLAPRLLQFLPLDVLFRQ